MIPDRRPRVAFATSRDYPELSPGDRLAVDVLERLGLDAGPAIWDAPRAHWDTYDLVVVRSCWDYHLRPLEFLAWLRALESDGVPVANPADVVRWNMDKRYLLELARAGVPVTPTELLDAHDEGGLGAVLERRGWERAVVKPCISASSYRTHVTTRGETAGFEQRLAQLLDAGPVLVQEFLPEVPAGEWSLMSVGGGFSHAVVKRAEPGDFRVQEEFGGSTSLEPAPPAVASAAVRILEQAAALAPALSDLLYARVDGVVRDGAFVLTELELIEPELFLDRADGAPQRFAEAISRRLSSAPPAMPGA